ncbi:hydroxyisourate hydrolase [Vibrio natriegens]|uniref:hydroxyisourate hydrolase n=1 Tax=Vibrio sp. (strain EJY3) TaxID=1116375 RepID=UPI000243B9A1|nr:hydroxyisourate hydrolase [Vibrio sp. EJY3]AEX23834.1 hydroxyisourate hydrolase [Vibrio sp. EJY3]
MKQLSCHVLDTANGKPAAGIQVQLFGLNDQICLAEATTDQDGRAKFPELILEKQGYTLRFLVAPYCDAQFGSAFFPLIDVNFNVYDEGNYHIPLLLSPFSYSSYRGS